jgi:integrase
MARDKLTAAHVAAFKKDPAKHAGKHFDGGGLFLLVTAEGGLYWRYKYRLGGVEKKFAIGTIDDYSLAEARIEHEKARKLVLAGDHPVDARKETKAAKEVERAGRTSFREVAKEYYDTMIPATVAFSTRRRHDKSLERLNAGFGSKDLQSVTVGDLATVLKKVQATGHYSMRERVQHLAVKIMAFAVTQGYLTHNGFLNISFNDGFISPDETYEARAAITEIEPFGKLLRAIDRAPGEEPMCIIGLRLLNLLAVRPGELAKAEWKNIDLRAAKMTVPFAMLKQRTQRKKRKDPRAGKNFEVPLSRQAIAELQALRKLTGEHSHLFPAFSIRRHKNPHMRAAQFNNILRRMGYENEHCAHGFRSSFSTIMNAERLQVGERKVQRWAYQDALIEVQLDHNDASTKGIYDRGGYWEDRAEIMQAWADRIDEMRGDRATRLRLVA